MKALNFKPTGIPCLRPRARGVGHFSYRGILSALCAAALLMLASACGSVSASDFNGHILVVDGSGAPIMGAVIYPDYEYSSSQRQYTRGDMEAHASNANGMIQVDLDDFLWDRDGCYHFVIRKDGYEDATMSVSRDLLPSLLRVALAPRSNPGPRPPGR